MPDVSLFSYVLWAASFGSYAVLALLMWRRGAHRRWTFLFCYAALSTLVSPILFTFFRREDAMAYFWTYWIERCLLSACRFGIIWQIASSLIGVNARLRRMLVKAMTALTPLIGCISAWVALSVHSPYYYVTSRVFLSVDRWLALAACLMFFTVAVSLDTLGVRWRIEVLIVGIGLALQGAAFSTFAWVITLKTFTQTGIQWPSIVRDLADLAIVILWSTVFLKSRKDRDESPFSAKRLETLIGSINETKKSLLI